MKNIITIIIVGLILSLIVYFSAVPSGRAVWNNWWYGVEKADDVTNYDTLKKVEDTCRAMISSYESDKLTYEQYKDSTNEDQMNWAAQAKMRANKTAVEYNNYILKNSFVWKNNVPSDIYTALDVIE